MLCGNILSHGIVFPQAARDRKVIVGQKAAGAMACGRKGKE